ncbi:hypothetical protein [Streptomyces sp. NBC_01546]|uniref:hypothetical protein n=1 Tax=Streptomyces sp. NBC_01546 TaxID=2975872 RepID=UPI002F90CFF0
MNGDVAVGLIGLGGALLGAAGAVVGGWVQQWQLAKNAASERREQRALAAGDEALLQLVHLVRELQMAQMTRSAGSDTDHVGDLIRRFGRDAETALLRLPGAADLRERMAAIFICLNAYEGPPCTNGLLDLICTEGAAEDQRGREFQWALFWADRGVEVLGAFLRGEKLPTPDSAEHTASLGTLVPNGSLAEAS